MNITISGIRFGLRRSGDTKAELGLLRRLERLEGEEESKRKKQEKRSRREREGGEKKREMRKKKREEGGGREEYLENGLKLVGFWGIFGSLELDLQFLRLDWLRCLLWLLLLLLLERRSVNMVEEKEGGRR